jgi:hypothetical protein
VNNLFILAKVYPRLVDFNHACDVPTLPRPLCSENRVPKEIKADIEYQNRKLLSAYVKRAMDQTCVPRHKPKFGFDLYDVSLSIFVKLCPSVPARFLDNSRFLFKYLHYVSSEGRTELISKENYEKVHQVLHRCMANVKVHKAYMDDCYEKVGENIFYGFDG